MSTPLRTGTTLGSYRIVAPLGAGGMGEVYRAHDSKLDRAVALKILPAEVVKDTERVRRFVQEARSASSLSHPNIVHIYDIGEAVPVEEGAEPAADAVKVHYIAMELVEGSTLRQLFDDRSAEPRTLLTYLAQAAEGLAKAHAAGIVHRDLKPENIMVTRDGYAKVLDFGLAKLTEPTVSGSALAAAPTALAEEHTREGAVMGTIGYMSPEQAQGKPVDHRTDLFAFGCLLYEAATGKKPFTGESSVDVLHAIVRQKPAPVEEIAPTIPSVLVRTIRRCLAKDPERRYQSMKDLALELHETAEEWETLPTPSGTVSSASALSSTAPAARVGISWTVWLAIGAGAAAIAVAAFVLGRGGSPSTPAATTFQSMKITTATTSGDLDAAALSPDGRYLVSVRNIEQAWSLWLRQLATGTEVELVPPQATRAIVNPIVTPDGEYVCYLLTDERFARFTLYRVPVLGGVPREVLANVDSLVTFSPDGRRIAFVRHSVLRQEQALMTANADGSGDEKTLATRSEKDGAGFATRRADVGPAWSPDGRSIAVSAWSIDQGKLRGEIDLVDSDGGEPKPLGSMRWSKVQGIAWLPNGRFLVVAGIPLDSTSGSQIWRVPADGGAPSRITNDATSYSGVSLSADGSKLATRQVTISSSLWSRPLDGGGEPRMLIPSSAAAINDVQVSDDGSIFYETRRGEESTLNRLDPGGADPLPLSQGGVWWSGEQVSRDGKTIVVRSRRPGGEVVLLTMDRQGGHQRQLPPLGAAEPFALYPDGTWYVAGDEHGLWRQPIDGGPATPFIATPGAQAIEFSPDGSRFAYLEPKAGANSGEDAQISIASATDGSKLGFIPHPKGYFYFPKWAPDGKSLVSLEKEKDQYVLWHLAFDGSPMRRFGQFKAGQVGDFRITPDGKALVYVQSVETKDAVLIENFH